MPRCSISILTLSLCLVACGGDDSSSGDNRVISELTAAELDEVCRENVTPVSEREERALARALCLATSQLGGCTEEKVATCIDMVLGQPDQEPDPNAGCELNLDPAACAVTVDQLFECANARRDALATFAENLTCENFAEIGNMEVPLPDACGVVQEKCPSSLETNGS